MVVIMVAVAGFTMGMLAGYAVLEVVSRRSVKGLL